MKEYWLPLALLFAAAITAGWLFHTLVQPLWDGIVEDFKRLDKWEKKLNAERKALGLPPVKKE